MKKREPMNQQINLRHIVLTFILAAMSLAASAQHVVKGTVSDGKDPLIGASVYVKDGKAQSGAITDLDGNFTITVPNKKSILIFSYVGYRDKAVVVGDKNTINVVLDGDTRMLDEAIVIGYGTQVKSHLTGSVAKLDGERLTNAPVSDVTSALQGAMPGLNINNITSEVGVAPSLRVRGTGSISADSEPLVIIDGMPVEGGLQYVNASDIKSVEILKDAASASIYGARGAFGVLLITTKSKTKHERLSVKYTNNFAWRTPTKTPKQLPGWQQADINLQGVINQTKGATAFYNVVGNMRVDATAVQKMKEYWEQYGYGTQFGRDMELGRDFEFRDGGMFFYRTWDWYDEYIKDWSPQQTHNISINGGNGKTNYNVALGYLGQEGMMKVGSDK